MGLFDPINWQGWPQFGSLGQEFIENAPNAGYQKLMGQMGLISSQTPFGKYAAGQRDDAYNTYLGKLAGMTSDSSYGDPQQYGYVDFLKEWGPQLSTSFMQQNASQRGEKFGGGAPRARWIGWPS